MQRARQRTYRRGCRRDQGRTAGFGLLQQNLDHTPPCTSSREHERGRSEVGYLPVEVMVDDVGGRGGQRCACADALRSGWAACCPCPCSNRAEISNCGVGSASHLLYEEGRAPADSLSCERIGKEVRLTHGQCKEVRNVSCARAKANSREHNRTGALVDPGIYLARVTAKTGRGEFEITRPFAVAY